MPTYLYCLLSAGPAEQALTPVRDIAGIGGAPVRPLRVDDASGVIEAWVSTIDDAALRATDTGETAALALTHNAVVEAALATGRTPIPARFGQRFADDAACIADIGRRVLGLQALLARVAGCVEMGVLLAPERPVTTHEASEPARIPHSGEARAGRRYLDVLRARAHSDDTARAQAEAELERLSTAVRPLARDEARRRNAQGVWSLSHLVARESVQAYREAMRALVPGGDFRLIDSGPRAPYSFVAEPAMGRMGHDSSNLSSSE